jgi:hypothetical protein
MTQRSVKKLIATMKIEAKGDNDLPFVECQAEIVSIEDIETKFGKKVIANLNNDTQGEFAVFVNNFSMEKLIEAYGSDDNGFIGKFVNLAKEKDTTFGKEMIVLNPVD